MDKESYFYLLKAIDENGVSIFAQRLSSNNASYEPTLTYRAEYALRCQTYDEIKKAEKEIKEFGNNVSRINFKVVKYLMPREQLSWSPPKNYVFREYEGLLNGKGYE